MKFNEHTAIVTEKVLLVPYEKHHVPTYHQWMTDESLLALTASEPLSLPEEYAMQSSWRHDHDKLTFIICLLPSPTPPSSSSPAVPQSSSHPSLPSSPTLARIIPTHHDSPAQMIGDINLFLTPDDSESAEPSLPSAPDPPQYLVGEIEIMVAVPSARRSGYGRAALQAFIAYIKVHLDEILAEYAAGLSRPEAQGQTNGLDGQHARGGAGQREVELAYLRVKIGRENTGSIALFEGVGFRKVGEVNFFGEVEMRRNVEWMGDGEGGREVEYVYREGVEGEGHPVDGS
ncbi:hypothetical protein KVT40_008509 [Elsinoe batatas]|uniref:N-acetyltransferase domain-containing protein n=1 Tax=Elsinoe batatas TaxID=2601811 RepID=A0A8K0PDW6_9PEZI|nr:hypothetical protein KVT40_008509 [Elsinoe batatas]